MSIVKKVEIDGKQVPFKASAAIPRIYRLKFQRDIYKDLSVLEKSINQANPDDSNLDLFSLEMFENIAFVMASMRIQTFRIHQRSGWINSIRFLFIRCCRSLLSFGD